MNPNRPMPKRKKEQLQAKALLNNVVIIPAAETDSLATAHTAVESVLHSEDDDDNRQSDVPSPSSSCSEDMEANPSVLPESVIVDEDIDPAVALGDQEYGANVDIFGDLPDNDIVPSVPSPLPEEVIQDKRPRDKKVVSPVPSDASDSSVDLADLALQLTPEERRRIRRKHKEERRRAREREEQGKLKRSRELELAKKDRFFDRSRILPDSIYFGDIVVPLHVLHSYGQEELKKDVQQHPIGGRPSQSPGQTTIRRAPGYKNQRIERMKKYLRSAGILQSEYRHKLNDSVDVITQLSFMLKLLKDKGLEGDPTMAKCKALKRKNTRGRDEYESTDESDELDTSVIINPKGRTLRSGTTIPLEDPPNPVDEIPIAEENPGELLLDKETTEINQTEITNTDIVRSPVSGTDEHPVMEPTVSTENPD